MTNHSLPTGPSGSEGDSEKKKWGYKRQQFDAVVSKTRFNGAIDGLVSGQLEVHALLTILDELNGVNQRGRYMAEVLALKQESRRLATVPFSERVAEFLVEGSRRIPWLSDGLASQFAVTLASAADNPAYLDTVNTAVSNLLLDLDRPLKSDTRNFLRALTDKIDATRRLQEARGLLATVPSVYPPAMPVQLSNAESPVPPSVDSPDEYDSELDPSELQSEADAPDDEVTSREGRGRPAASEIAAGVIAVGKGTASSDEFLEPAQAKFGPKLTTQRTLIMPVGATPSEQVPAEPGAQVLAPSADASPSGDELPAPRVTRAKTLIGIATGGIATGGIVDETSPSPTHATTPSEDLGVLQHAQTVMADAVAAPDTVEVPAAVTATPGSLASRAPSKGRIATAPGVGHAPAESPSQGQIIPAPSVSHAPPVAPSRRSKAASPVTSEGQTQPGLGQSSATDVPSAIGEGSAESPSNEDVESAKIPTSRIPVWLIALAVGGVVAGGAGLWWLFRDAGVIGEQTPEASASAAAVGSAAPKAAKRRGSKSAKAAASAAGSAVAAPAAPPAEPPPPVAQPAPPPPAAVAPAAMPPKANTAPIMRTPAAPPRATSVAHAPATPKPVASKPVVSKPITQPEPAPKPASKTEVEPPKPKVVAATPTPDAPAVPTTPKPSRTIDDILVELLQVPNDPASIESKAHDVARIVARAPKADAEHILRRLIPEEVLAGTETVDTRALEPVRRVVALLLKKVALDKDDNRAAMAIDSLGEWAKLRKHGAAAKLTLDELAEERVVLSRPARLRALERVQARLGISMVGE